ncbi:MAG: L-threonylcarbamoyladenylate synthase [Chloroflexi bacterium]|nr:L-threonylcarbamoyladenylate synthase [Chloroflexota bacterium]MDA1240120.1 L-threonylcarbamoyladenylate synthase [Chloroflexota bacterium]
MEPPFTPADLAEIVRAVAALRAGALVGLPTETVYGLAADASNAEAVRRVFAAKGRPADHPLIVHLADPASLDAWAAEVPHAARALAEAYWPGPLTLVVRRASHVLDEVTGGLDTVALRVPAHPVALAVLRAFGGGLAAPSANRFGRVSPTTAQAVHDEMGEAVALVLDGGPCDVGVESTIVDMTVDPPVVLRPGGVSAEEIARTVGAALGEQSDTRAPGTLAAHYAPAVEVVVVTAQDAASSATARIALGQRVGLLAPGVIPGLPAGIEILDAAGDAQGYARVLYERFREAERQGLDVLLCVPPEAAGVGAAVIDRLRRAAFGSATERE